MEWRSVIDVITGVPYTRLADALPGDCDRGTVHAVFEEIVADKLRTSAAVPVKRPFLLNVSGIPCSGKSTYCDALFSGRIGCGLDVAGAVFVGFDDIMEDGRLPYPVEASVDAESAFGRWELPARIAGYELLRRAVDRRLNIVFEHSSALEHHVDLFAGIMEEGYSFHFRYVAVRPEEAAGWLAMRRTRCGQTIKDYIFRRYETLTALLPEYEKMADTFQTVEQWQLC